DSAGADEHAAHKVFVTRNIDDSDRANAFERERREAKVDRDAAALLFGKPIGVDARQGFDESRLAMIDVLGRTDDHAALQRSCSQTANARRGRSSAMCALRNSRSRR